MSFFFFLCWNWRKSELKHKTTMIYSTNLWHYRKGGYKEDAVTVYLRQKCFSVAWILESLRLEKASKITKSNCHPTPTVPLPMSLSTTQLLNTSRDSDSTTSLGSLLQYLITLSEKKFILIPNLNFPWHNLRPFSLILSVTWEEMRILLFYSLLSGGCGGQWGLPRASSSPESLK